MIKNVMAITLAFLMLLSVSYAFASEEIPTVEGNVSEETVIPDNSDAEFPESYVDDAPNTDITDNTDTDISDKVGADIADDTDTADTTDNADDKSDDESVDNDVIDQVETTPSTQLNSEGSSVEVIATQTVEAAFPDKNFRSIVCQKAGIVNTDDDISAHKTALSGIKEISAAGRGIESVEGVEYLSGLELLDIAENKIKSADLSKNTALKYLFIYSNPIESINLSANKSLLYIYAQNCGLKEITLPSSVTKAYLQGNNLTGFSGSSIYSLRELNVKSNAIKNISIASNSNLEYLWTGANKIKSMYLNNYCDFKIADLGTQIFSVGLKSKSDSLVFDSAWSISEMNREHTYGKFTFNLRELPFILSGVVLVKGYEMAVQGKIVNITADFSENMIVDAADLSKLLSTYGTINEECDITGDKLVNALDLSRLLGSYGSGADY